MTKDEFIRSVPSVIEHPIYGFGTLEIVADTFLKKAAFYRHPDNTTSYWCFGNSWEEIKEKMSLHLNRHVTKT